MFNREKINGLQEKISRLQERNEDLQKESNCQTDLISRFVNVSRIYPEHVYAPSWHKFEWHVKKLEENKAERLEREKIEAIITSLVKKNALKEQP